MCSGDLEAWAARLEREQESTLDGEHRTEIESLTQRRSVRRQNAAIAAGPDGADVAAVLILRSGATRRMAEVYLRMYGKVT